MAKGIREASDAEVIFNVVLSAVILITGIQRLRTFAMDVFSCALIMNNCGAMKGPDPLQSVLLLWHRQDNQKLRCCAEVLGRHFNPDLRSLSSLGSTSSGLDSLFRIRQLDQPPLGSSLGLLLCEVAVADQEVE